MPFCCLYQNSTFVWLLFCIFTWKYFVPIVWSLIYFSPWEVVLIQGGNHPVIFCLHGVTHNRRMWQIPSIVKEESLSYLHIVPAQSGKIFPWSPYFVVFSKSESSILYFLLFHFLFWCVPWTATCTLEYC